MIDHKPDQLRYKDNMGEYINVYATSLQKRWWWPTWLMIWRFSLYSSSSVLPRAILAIEFFPRKSLLSFQSMRIFLIREDLKFSNFKWKRLQYSSIEALNVSTIVVFSSRPFEFTLVKDTTLFLFDLGIFLLFSFPSFYFELLTILSLSCDERASVTVGKELSRKLSSSGIARYWLLLSNDWLEMEMLKIASSSIIVHQRVASPVAYTYLP